MIVLFLWMYVGALFFLIETRGSEVGSMEARGNAEPRRGNTWTNWNAWKRVETTDHFPDGRVGSFRVD